MEFFSKSFYWIQQIQWQKYFSIKGLKPVTFFVRDQDATTVPARRMWDRIFKLTPINASVIYQIRWIHWKFCSI